MKNNPYKSIAFAINRARAAQARAERANTPQAWNDAAKAWRNVGDESRALLCDASAKKCAAKVAKKIAQTKKSNASIKERRELPQEAQGAKIVICEKRVSKIMEVVSLDAYGDAIDGGEYVPLVGYAE